MRRFGSNRSLSVEARTRMLEDWAVSVSSGTAEERSSQGGSAGSGQAGLAGAVPQSAPPAAPSAPVFAVRTITANDTATTSDGVILVDATAGNVTLTLPPAASMRGRVLIVKKIAGANANTVTLDGNGAETIDGDATYAFYVPYSAVAVTSDGSAWWIF